MTDQLQELYCLSESPQKSLISKKRFIQLLALFLLSGILNICIATTGFFHERRFIQPIEKIVLGVSLNTFVVIPVISLILSLVCSLAPYKSLKYSTKFLAFALIIAILLEAIITISLIIGIL